MFKSRKFDFFTQKYFVSKFDFIIIISKKILIILPIQKFKFIIYYVQLLDFNIKMLNYTNII